MKSCIYTLICYELRSPTIWFIGLNETSIIGNQQGWKYVNDVYFLNRIYEKMILDRTNCIKFWLQKTKVRPP